VGLGLSSRRRARGDGNEMELALRDLDHQKRFFANARPEWDLRYFSNASALYLSGNAQYQINSQGLNLAVCVDLPALCSGIRRFKSAVAPTYSCSGKLMLR